MNEEQHFLKAINASEPNADLVYADWLEEQGRSEADEVRENIVVLRAWSWFHSCSWSYCCANSWSLSAFSSWYCSSSWCWSRSRSGFNYRSWSRSD